MIRSRRRTRHPLDGPGLGDGFVPNWSPRQLGLRALYDYRNSTPTAMVDQSGNGRADATVGGGSNSPLWLPYTIPSLYCPPLNLVSTPHNASLVWTAGTIQITARITMLQAAVSTSTYLILKGGAYASREYSLLLSPGGNLAVYTRDSGGGAVDEVSSASAALAIGIPTYVRATLTPSAGTIVFERSADGVAWSAVGTTISRAAWTPIASNGILGTSGSGDPAAYKLHGASVALNGSIVANFDASLCTQTGFTDGYGNPWTITRTATGRKSVIQSPAAASDHGVWLFGADDFMDLPAASIPRLTASDTSSTFVVVRLWGTQSDSFDVALTMGGYTAVSPGLTLRHPASGGTFRAYVSDGGGTNPSVASGGTYTDGTKALLGATVRPSTFTAYLNGSAGSAAAMPAGDRTPTLGRIGGASGATFCLDAEVLAYGALDRELQAAEWSAIGSYYRVGS